MERVHKIAKSDSQILIYPFYRTEQLDSYWKDCHAILTFERHSKICQKFRCN